MANPPSWNCRRKLSEAIGDEVVSEIIAATERGPSNHDYGVGGHEAFTSIVFAPKVFCNRQYVLICAFSFLFSFLPTESSLWSARLRPSFFSYLT